MFAWKPKRNYFPAYRLRAPSIPMSDDPDKDDVPEAIEIQFYFVRERNALLVRGDFSPIYTD